MAEQNYIAVDFHGLPSASDGQTLLYSGGQVCQSEKDLGELIGEETSGKLDTTAFENVSGNFALSADVYNKTEIDEKLANFGGFEVVDLTTGENPVPDVANPSTKIIYLTKEEGSTKTDPYTEWIYTVDGSTTAWEVIGETTIDMSNYYTKFETSGAEEISAALETKQDNLVPGLNIELKPINEEIVSVKRIYSNTFKRYVYSEKELSIPNVWEGDVTSIPIRNALTFTFENPINSYNEILLQISSSSDPNDSATKFVDLTNRNVGDSIYDLYSHTTDIIVTDIGENYITIEQDYNVPYVYIHSISETPISVHLNTIRNNEEVDEDVDLTNLPFTWYTSSGTNPYGLNNLKLTFKHNLNYYTSLVFCVENGTGPTAPKEIDLLNINVGDTIAVSPYQPQVMKVKEIGDDYIIFELTVSGPNFKLYYLNTDPNDIKSSEIKTFGSDTVSYASANSFAIGNNTIATGNNSFACGWNTSALGENSVAEGTNTFALGYISHAEGCQTTASNSYTHAEGYNTVAGYPYSHAEGLGSNAYGDAAHAEGRYTTAWANYAHSEGNQTKATGGNSHAEGDSTSATNGNAHAEGWHSLAAGNCSHAEGDSTYAYGDQSHSEGYHTTANSQYSHAEGNTTLAYGTHSHSQNYRTTANGEASNAEGYYTSAGGSYSHTEGQSTSANGAASHAEGNSTYAEGNYSHAEGWVTNAKGNGTHSEGYYTIASSNFGYGNHSEGYYTSAIGNYGNHSEGRTTLASGNQSHAEGYNTIASGDTSHAEGYNTSAIGSTTHAEGYKTLASGMYSHSEGFNTSSMGSYSHVGGSGTFASGDNSFAHGEACTASGRGAFAVGYYTSAFCNGYQGTFAAGYKTSANGQGSFSVGTETSAIGIAAHSEGNKTYAKGDCTHAEGYCTSAIKQCSHAEGSRTSAAGEFSHAEGYFTSAIGNYSHAAGYYTKANNSAMTVIGKYNKTTLGSFVIGNGTSTTQSDAFIVDWDGVASAVNLKTSAGQVIATNSTPTDGQVLTYDGTNNSAVWAQAPTPTTEILSAGYGITFREDTSNNVTYVDVNSADYKLFTTTEYNSLTGQIQTLENFGSWEIVASTGAIQNPNAKTIYLIKDTTVTGTDKYSEWICTNTATPVYEKIGDTSIDLSNYLTKTSADVDYQPKGDYVPLSTYNTLTAKVQELEALLTTYSGLWVLTNTPQNNG